MGTEGNGRAGGFFQLSNEVISLSKDWQPATIRVLLYLSKCGDSGGCSWPSNLTTAQATGLHPRTVQRAARVLEDAGLLTIRRKQPGEAGYGETPNTYELCDRLQPRGTHRPPVPMAQGPPVACWPPVPLASRPPEGWSTDQGTGGVEATQRIPIEEDPKNKKKKREADWPPEEVLDWCRWWNSLKEDGWVQCGVRETRDPPPGIELRRGWSRVKKSADLRNMLQDRVALATAIRESDFVREGNWFTLDKLLGGTNRSGALIVERLLAGGYQNGIGKKPKTVTQETLDGIFED